MLFSFYLQSIMQLWLSPSSIQTWRAIVSIFHTQYKDLWVFSQIWACYGLIKIRLLVIRLLCTLLRLNTIFSIRLFYRECAKRSLIKLDKSSVALIIRRMLARKVNIQSEKSICILLRHKFTSQPTFNVIAGANCSYCCFPKSIIHCHLIGVK